MADLRERYRSLLRASGPDLWNDIKEREPTRAYTDASSGHRLVVIVVALGIAAAGLIPIVGAFVSRQSGPTRTDQPAFDPHIVASSPVAPRGQSTAVFVADGSVWVTAFGVESEKDHLLRRIDPTTNEIFADVRLEGIPGWETGGGGIAFSADSLWVVGVRSTENGPEAILQRVDPSSNRVVETIPLFGTIAWDVAASSSSIWVASSSEDAAEIARIDPLTNNIVARTPLANRYVRRVVATDDVVVVEEKVWPDEASGPVTVIETVDPQTDSVIARSEAWTEAGEVVRVDGQLWATFPGGGFRLIDSSDAGPLSDVLAQEVTPCCNLVAPGVDGVWIFDDGRLTLVDPKAGKVATALSMPGISVTAAAATADSVWVLSFDGRLTRVDLH
jgi:hypothetical protein